MKNKIVFPGESADAGKNNFLRNVTITRRRRHDACEAVGKYLHTVSEKVYRSHLCSE